MNGAFFFATNRPVTNAYTVLDVVAFFNEMVSVEAMMSVVV